MVEFHPGYLLNALIFALQLACGVWFVLSQDWTPFIAVLALSLALPLVTMFVAQAAAQRMLKKGAGTILFTGASASVKGYAQSATFAMGKFALRGLAQSTARELAPQNIHVAHVVIDGGISSAERPVNPGEVVATIYKSLGLDLDTHLPGPQGRPFALVDFGVREVKELF